MPLAERRQPFDHPNWLFEVKYDGFRALAYLERGAVRLVSRKGNTYKSFPTLCQALGAWMRAGLIDFQVVPLVAYPGFARLFGRKW
jgi:bifunctional non-homologous end joining protein LigD